MAGKTISGRRDGLDGQLAWVRGLIDVTVRAPVLLAWELTACGLVLCWGVAYGVGGTKVVTPTWFVLVIVLSAVRFGWRGALVTAVASGLLAGPFLPADVALGIAQGTGTWLAQTVTFVIIGQLVAFLLALSTLSLDDQVLWMRNERDLLRGLSMGEFRVVFQPIVALDSERVIGVECLARWDRPDQGTISPEEFIPIAESSGAIHALSRFVLRESCRQVATWKQTVLRDTTSFTVAVNVSTRQLKDPALADQVAAVLEDTGLDSSWLYLEVTETALIADLDAVLAPIGIIRELGVRFAIDDFGTGYSSLSYLHRLPADVVKIDRAFTASLGEPGPAGAIAPLVVNLAAQCGITTIAEGVETLDQVRRLREIGCQNAQGFYFGRPLEPDAMRVLLASDRAAGPLPVNGSNAAWA